MELDRLYLERDPENITRMELDRLYLERDPEDITRMELDRLYLERDPEDITRMELDRLYLERDPEDITRMELDRLYLERDPEDRPHIVWMDNIRRANNDGRHEGVVKYGGHGRHTLVYRIQCDQIDVSIKLTLVHQ